jgi:hypothetical protein
MKTVAKNPRRAPVVLSKPVAPPLFSRQGKIIMVSGGGMVLLGFFLLTFTDPSGRNWASHWAPAFLVLGYSLIGVGIVWRSPQ